LEREDLMNVQAIPAASGDNFDVVVVGAGLGGVYAIHRFRQQGLSVLGVEGGGDVGVVWYHNRYPGARVDLESQDYCYFFSRELYNDWKWSERYATQPELLAYINHVTDRFDIRRHIRFNTWLTAAHWSGDRWHCRSHDGRSFTGRFLVMAVGNLSAARKPEFKGIDTYKGEWVQTSHWPQREVKFAGRRIGIIGTGSSGVQTAPVVAKEAKHLYVFQRTPNFSVPAHNGPLDEELYEKIKDDVAATKESLFYHPGGSHIELGKRKAEEYTPAEMRAEMERKWAVGGHGMNAIFADQGSSQATNDIVSNFVRDKIRQIVKDQVVAERLLPYDHPMGTRRLCVDTDYYATFNRPNVTLVDARDEGIVEITETGIRTTKNHYDLNLIIFALGFEAFTGQVDRIDMRNEEGAHPSDRWKQGPRTYLGLMTSGFPNYFWLTGPGSPSVLANMFLQNEYHVDWVGDCIDYINRNGYATIEPTVEAEDAWTAHVAEVSQTILRLRVKNYMSHLNADGSRVFIPYVGGFDRYVKRCREVVARGYEGFRFGRARASTEKESVTA
jgi:cation diffusion facilitator CzcD-associated flavoprotein CzcO